MFSGASVKSVGLFMYLKLHTHLSVLHRRAASCNLHWQLSNVCCDPANKGWSRGGWFPTLPLTAELIKNWNHKSLKFWCKKISLMWIQPSRWKAFPSQSLAFASGLSSKMWLWKEPGASKQGHGSKGTVLFPAWGTGVAPSNLCRAWDSRTNLIRWEKTFCLMGETLSRTMRWLEYLVFVEELLLCQASHELVPQWNTF